MERDAVDTPQGQAYDSMMTRVAFAACLAVVALSWTADGRAQQAPAAPGSPQQPAQPPPPTAKTGNPTPGTPQPDPPNVADRIAVSGCLQLAPGAGAAPASAATAPASNRFVLKDVRKDARVPPNTGTSPAAAAASAATYRLEALESQLSPFVDTRIEVSGEVKGSPEAAPVLLVEFVRKLAARCQ
jgi:hypothetical protein